MKQLVLHIFVSVRTKVTCLLVFKYCSACVFSDSFYFICLNTHFSCHFTVSSILEADHQNIINIFTIASWHLPYALAFTLCLGHTEFLSWASITPTADTANFTKMYINFTGGGPAVGPLPAGCLPAHCRPTTGPPLTLKKLQIGGRWLSAGGGPAVGRRLAGGGLGDSLQIIIII